MEEVLEDERRGRQRNWSDHQWRSGWERYRVVVEVVMVVVGGRYDATDKQNSRID